MDDPQHTKLGKKLRTDLIRFEQPDGEIELLDLVLEQLHTFSANEARALHAMQDRAIPVAEALDAKLRKWHLYEGPDIDALRKGAKFARIRARMPPPPRVSAEGLWALADNLPDWIAPTWRRPERWRRLAEDYLAGRALLRLEGLMDPDAAQQLRAEVEALEFTRLDSMYAVGGCHNVQGTTLARWLTPFRSGPLMQLLAHVLRETLPTRIFARAWCLGPGDGMGVHRDGIHYVGTFSIGLCADWTVGHGGHIAFGIPSVTGLGITERWLPHLGDMLLFRPTAMDWHAVETVRAGTRFTLTGHYVAPTYPDPDS